MDVNRMGNLSSFIYFYCSKDLNHDSYSELELSGMGGTVVWTHLTARYLNRKGFRVECGNKPPEKGVIFFHGRERKKLMKSLNGFDGVTLVCIQADCDLKIKFCDYWVFQNMAQLSAGSLPYDKFIHHWPQPSLIKRDSSRGSLIENIHYKGLGKNFSFDLNSLMNDDSSGCTFRYGEGEENKEFFWRDYSTADLILAVRPSDNDLWINKPASKLINAWAAEVPALLGKESGYRSLRKSELDYIEVSSVRDILDAIKYLKKNKNLYSDMVSNGLERSKLYDVDAISNNWIKIFNDILDSKSSRYKYINKLPKRMAYFLRNNLNLNY